MQEIYIVARTPVIALPVDAICKTIAFVDTLTAGRTTSLQRDIEEGKPSELDSGNGAVVRLGREVEVTTPLNAFIYHSLLTLEMRLRGQRLFARNRRRGLF